MSLLNSIYRFGSLPLSLLAAPAFLTRERGRARFWERFGDWRLPKGRYLWFHGASLGEVQGLVPLLKLVRERFPNKKILVTVTSVTGISAIEKLADQVRVLPLDSPLWIKRALVGAEIEALIITETELWPCLLDVVGKLGIPIALVNGKISDLTHGRYAILSGMFRDHLSSMRMVIVSDSKSKERFENLGAQSSKTLTLGNTKYDRLPGVASKEESRVLKSKYFVNSDPVAVLGSLHPDETQLWIDAMKIAKASGKMPNMIVAPRHKEKFAIIADVLAREGFPFSRKTAMRDATTEKVVLLDTIGELERVYSFANGAFIGATLNRLGGHNPMEAAPYGVALAFGGNTHNIEEIVDSLKAVNGCYRIATKDDAAKFLMDIYDSAPHIVECGEKVKAIWQQSFGASERVLVALLKGEVFHDV